MADKSAPGLGISTVDQATFASVMGQAVWLMTMSNRHRELPIRIIEERVAPALLFRSFKLYSKDNQPVAFLTWAAVSPEIKQRLAAGDYELKPEEWRSGAEIVVIECVSPFAPEETVISEFSRGARDAVKSGVSS